MSSKSELVAGVYTQQPTAESGAALTEVAAPGCLAIMELVVVAVQRTFAPREKACIGDSLSQLAVEEPTTLVYRLTAEQAVGRAVSTVQVPTLERVLLKHAAAQVTTVAQTANLELVETVRQHLRFLTALEEAVVGLVVVRAKQEAAVHRTLRCSNRLLQHRTDARAVAILTSNMMYQSTKSH